MSSLSLPSAGPSSGKGTASRSGKKVRGSNQKWFAAGVAVALLLLLVLATFSRQVDKELLSINNPTDNGAMALAQILRDHGVLVENGYTLGDVQPNDKQVVVITQVGKFSEENLRKIVEKADHVVFLGTWLQEWAVASWASSVPGNTHRPLPPQCDWPVARRAGKISETNSALIVNPEQATQFQSCYPVGGQSGPGQSGFAVLHSEKTKPTLTIVADQTLLTNQKLAQAGNAALGIGTLGRYDSVLWLSGANFTAPSRDEKLVSTVPTWVWAASALAFLAVALWGLAAGWRFGPVLHTALPVTVPSGEIVHGRARLLQRHGAWEHMTQVMRREYAGRLARQCSLPTWSTPAQVVQELQNAGVNPQLAEHAFYSPPATTPAQTRQIISELQEIERTVKAQEGMQDG